MRAVPRSDIKLFVPRGGFRVLVEVEATWFLAEVISRLALGLVFAAAC